MNLNKLTWFFVLLFCSFCNSFITRLPCLKSAFWLVKQKAYGHADNNNVILNDVPTQSDCRRACVANSSCIYVNYESARHLCLLMLKVADVITDESKPWAMVYTNRKNAFKRGPQCESKQLCAQGEYCRDVCKMSTPYGATYKCLKHTNVAMITGIASASSTYVEDGNPYPAKNAIDGNAITLGATLTSDPAPWLIVNLQYVYPITKIHIITHHENLQTGFKLFVGVNENEFEEVGVLSNETDQVFLMDRSVQFVKIADKEAENLGVSIYDIKIFI